MKFDYDSKYFIESEDDEFVKISRYQIHFYINDKWYKKHFEKPVRSTKQRKKELEEK